MLGRHQRSGRLGGTARGFVGGIDGVRFRSQGDVDKRLRDRQFALGAAKPFEGFPALKADRLRLRIGKADIFDRHPGNSARKVTGIFARIQHPRKPVKCRVRVGAAHRFVQRRDQIVMRITGFVVLCSPLHQTLRQRRAIQLFVRFPRHHLFDQVEQRTPVAIRHLEQILPRRPIKREGAVQFHFGPLRKPFQIGQVEPLEYQNLRPAEQSGVQLEGWVFRSGTDQ